MIFYILHHTWPYLFRRSSESLEYGEELLIYSGIHKHGLMSDHLKEYAPNSPHIDGGRIILRSEYYIGWTIPESYYFVRKCFRRNRLCSSQTKVCKFKLAFFIYEQVLWLQISVQNFSAMNVCKSSENLEEKNLQEDNKLFTAQDDLSTYFCIVHTQEIFAKVHVLSQILFLLNIN